MVNATSSTVPGSVTGSSNVPGDSVPLYGGRGQLPATFLTPVPPVAADATARPGDFIPADATAASRTITLPAHPADRTMAGVKMIALGGSNTVTVTCGAGDHFNIAAGATTLTLRLLMQGAVMQYNAAAHLWYVQADDLPLAQLDSRYAATGAGGPPSGAAGGDLGGTYPDPAVTATHLTAALPVAQGGTSAATAAAALASLGAVPLAGGTMTGALTLAGIPALAVPEGANAAMGTAILAGGTVTVATTAVSAATRIFLTVQGGDLTHVGTPYVSSVTPGTGFVITSTDAADVSTVGWHLIDHA